MIKLLHFADLHLGVENYGRPDPATGLHTRLLDFLRSFDEMIDRAEDEKVDLAIFAGDAYKTRNPSPTHQREFALRIVRLAEQCPVILLAGNHDVYNAKGRANTLDIFGILSTPGSARYPITVADRPGIVKVTTDSNEDIQIVTLPWVVRSHLLAAAPTVGHTGGGVTKTIEDKLRALVEGLLAQINPSLPTVMTAHGTVPGAVYGSEHTVMLGREIMLPLELLADRRVNYVALGHIHRHQVLCQDPPVVYPGSIDRVDFGEEHEAKGFVLAHLEGAVHGARYEFVELQSTRPFVTVEVEVDGDEPLPQVQGAIEDKDIRDAIVRLIIHTTPESNALLRHEDVQQALDGAHHVASIVRDVKRQTRQRLNSDQNVAQMTATELLSSYFDSRETLRPRAEMLVEHAQALMTSVDQGGDG